MNRRVASVLVAGFAALVLGPATAQAAERLGLGVPFELRTFESLGPWMLAFSLAVATLVSEDLTCISAGLLVASGRMPATVAIVGCFLGIFAGDVLLYGIGRMFGTALLATGARLTIVTPAAIERGRTLLRDHGGKAIFFSRFVPGLRLPTYLASGAFAMPFLRFAAWFALAGLLWTPSLVLLSGALGERSLTLFARFHDYGALVLVGIVLGIFAVVRLVLSIASLFTWRGRRVWRGRLLRLRHFEFWPAWAFYPPVVFHLARLAWKHRREGGFAVVTAVNPAIENGGFIGESKLKILENLRGAGDLLAKSASVLASDPPAVRIAKVREFCATNALSLPLVLKPDVGQRGSGVRIVRDDPSLVAFLEHEMSLDHVVQEYVPGVEFGIFYVRHPTEEQGRIISITEKRMPVVVGDGDRTLENLILADERAVCAAKAYFERNEQRLSHVPARGERIQLVELGTHCRGAIFLDGEAIHTEALVTVIDRASRTFDGFYFGRYDVRAPSAEHFRRGEGIKIIELNGVTSEATHIYDPRMRLVDAYRVLFEQWRIAFAIGAHNAALGAPLTSPFALVSRFLRYRREQREHARN